ncbi:hypothetical protein Hte_007720 [Hypoxylon texense]
MVYTMEFRVDGGCRGNGTRWAIGAAAACRVFRGGGYQSRVRRLDDDEYFATSQRAELFAIILALQWASEKHRTLRHRPQLRVKIYSDSRYAVNCMKRWIDRWSQNGWRNSQGREVANLDLLRELDDLDDDVQELGSVEYICVPRAENQIADDACREALDDMEDDDDDDDDDLTSTESLSRYWP